MQLAEQPPCPYAFILSKTSSGGGDLATVVRRDTASEWRRDLPYQPAASEAGCRHAYEGTLSANGELMPPDKPSPEEAEEKRAAAEKAREIANGKRTQSKSAYKMSASQGSKAAVPFPRASMTSIK